MAKVKIEGLRELERTVSKLGQLPQKCVTKAAKKGANISQKAAKKGGWIDRTGNLRKGIILKGERSNVKGKKVYQVTMDKNMNDVFQKTAVHVKVLRVYHGQGRSRKDPRYEAKQYYYPASQEYGFQTRNGKYIPGFNFMKNAIEDNKPKIEKEIVDVLSKEIDKLE